MSEIPTWKELKDENEQLRKRLYLIIKMHKFEREKRLKLLEMLYDWENKIREL